MKAVIIPGGALSIFFALNALALEPIVTDCREPQAPAEAPDGLTADYRAMRASGDAHRLFNTAGHQYLLCLERSAVSQKRAATLAYGYGEKLAKRLRQIEAVHIATYNAFVDRLRVVADRYNAELREYQTQRAVERP